MIQFDAASIVKELTKERPNPEALRPSIEKLLDCDDTAFVGRCRALGSALSPELISKLIPQILDYGIVESCCDRAKFALEVIVGASRPDAPLGNADGRKETLWECAYREVRSRPAFAGASATFTPINGITIPASIIPGKDEPRMPSRDTMTWH